jgi:biotin carboxylase
MQAKGQKDSAFICMGAGNSQVPVIRKASQLGYKVIAIDRDSRALGFKNAHESVVASTHDFEDLFPKLEKLLDQYEILGILNRSSGPPVVSAAYLSKMLKLPGLTPEVAQTLVNKSELRKACKQYGIPIPAFAVAGETTDKLPSGFNWPVVVKPSLSLVGKSGISLVSDASGLKGAIKYARQFSLQDDLLIEEYLLGEDISLVSFVENGKLFPICILDEHNGIDSMGNIFGRGFSGPSKHTDTEIEFQIYKLSQKIIDIFQIRRAPFMVSFRLDSYSQPHLIEVHLDLGGDLLIENFFPRALEFDFLGLSVAMAMGIPVENINLEVSPTAILYEPGDALVNERNFKIIQSDNQLGLTEKIQEVLANA